MKKYLFIILLAVNICGQDWQHYYYFNQPTLSQYALLSLIPTATLDLTTDYPTPYDDFCLYLEQGQLARINHLDSMRFKSYRDHWEIRFERKRLASSVDVVAIMSLHLTGTGFQTNFILNHQQSTGFEQLRIGDTSYIVDTLINDTGQWLSIIIKFEKIGGIGTLTYSRDGVVRFSRVTNMPNITNAVGYGSFALGSPQEQQVGGFVDMSKFATYKGYFDNLKVIVDYKTYVKVDFNLGSMGQDSALYKQWPGGIQHDHVNHQVYDGYNFMGDDPYDGTYVWRSGTRKDVNRYFPLPPIRAYGTDYIRSSAAKVTTNPWDSTMVVIVGNFTHGKDSADVLSRHVCYYSSVDKQLHSMGTGLNVTNSFGFGALFLNEHEVIVSGLIDSAGGVNVRNIAKYNFQTGLWDSLAGGIDTNTSYGFFVREDTVWVSDGRRIKYFSYTDDSTWKTAFIFPYSVQGYTRVFVQGHTPGGIYIGVQGPEYAAIWRRTTGNNFEEWKKTKPYFGDSLYSVGGFSYWGAENDGNGRVWFGGDFDTLDGVKCGSLAYITADGVVHSVGFVRGMHGGTGEATYKGAFVNDITDIQPWQDGIIFIGSFTTVDGVPVGRCTFAWDEVRGVFPLDYGVAYRGQGLAVFDNDGYQDLFVISDGWDYNGLKTGMMAVRYSEAHFADIAPTIELVTMEDIPASEWPPVVSVIAESPAARPVTVSVDFWVNSDTNSFSLAKSDSNLTNIKSYWSFIWSAEFDNVPVLPGDTIYYTATVTDIINGKTATASDNFKISTDADLIFVRGYYPDSVQTFIRMFINYNLDTVWGGQYESIANIWDCFWLLGSADDTTARKDWVSGRVATNNSMTFTSMQGYIGNASSQYMNLNFNLSTAGLFKKDSGMVSLYSRTAAAGGIDFGVTGGGVSTIMAPNLASNSYYFNNNSTDITVAVGHSLGLFINNRTFIDTVQAWVNDTLKREAVITSGTVPNVNVFLSARNNAGTPANYAARQYWYVCIGRKFRTDAQAVLFGFGLKRLAQQMGVNVIP